MQQGWCTIEEKLYATSHRCVSSLANYDFSNTYRPGKYSTDADALYKKPQVCSDVVNAIYMHVGHHKRFFSCRNLVCCSSSQWNLKKKTHRDGQIDLRKEQKEG
jgi:hypothetical protein